MDIKCSCHPNNAAKYICEHCGFLCQDHEKEEYNLEHILIVINKPLVSLYSAMLGQKQNTIMPSAIYTVKQQITQMLYAELNSAAKDAKEFNQLVSTCEKGKFGISSLAASRHIYKQLYVSHTHIYSSNKIDVIDKMIAMLNGMKKELQLAADSTSECKQTVVFEDKPTANNLLALNEKGYVGFVNGTNSDGFAVIPNINSMAPLDNHDHIILKDDIEKKSQ